MKISSPQDITLQQAWDEWSSKFDGITGVDVWRCSHGRAFMAGWAAAFKVSAKLLNQMHDSAVMMSEPSGFLKKDIKK